MIRVGIGSQDGRRFVQIILRGPAVLLLVPLWPITKLVDATRLLIDAFRYGAEIRW